MRSRVAVVIPALDEEELVAGAVASSAAAGASRIIVVDGGSRDGTRAAASSAGAEVVSASPPRSAQMNVGARMVEEDVVLFLHADTMLPPAAAAAVLGAIDRGYIFGGFSIAFMEPDRRLRLPARLINLRTRITRCPWGDQAQFVVREVFERWGGYREIPLMEDYDLARRMRRRGRTVVLPEKVRTSGRRFLEKGNVRTAAINWTIIAAYHFGVDPARLARWYGR